MKDFFPVPIVNATVPFAGDALLRCLLILRPLFKMQAIGCFWVHAYADDDNVADLNGLCDCATPVKREKRQNDHLKWDLLVCASVYLYA